MKILTMTTLYPNAATPAHGVFVENRLRALADLSGAEIKVIAPTPWFPVNAAWAGRYARYAAAPLAEIRRGFDVRHPRYAIPPKIGMTYAVTALERCFLRAARSVMAEGFDFDVVDAHYLYPDGVAAARVARKLGKPVVLTARGTDVNLLPSFPRQRRMILDAVAQSDAVVTVADALRDELIRLGAPAERIRTLRNGVDLDTFRPLDRDAVREKFGLTGKAIASVGLLTERKGHHLVIEAMRELPDVSLLIAGEGEERRALETKIREASLCGRVRLLGALPHNALAELYSAVDALVLASSREGWPNVLLEAMACGTPAIATPVWGSGEVIRSPVAGKLAETRSAAAIAAAIREVLDNAPSRDDTRRYAEGFSWRETSENLESLFRDVIKQHGQSGAMTSVEDKVQFRPLAAATARPQLIVTVDTEEEFDWTRFDTTTHTVSAVAGIERFQSLAESAAVKPIYFLTYPLIDDDESRAYFRRLNESGRADLGLHLHQWVTPPDTGHRGEHFSYQCNLPADAHAAKLGALAQAFESAFGFRARSHRAGRYGISPLAYGAIGEIGVEFDFSPSVAFDFSSAGGPNFCGMSNKPFIAETPAGAEICVTPVCGGRAWLGGARFLPERANSPGIPARPRSLFRQFTAPMRLTCEGAALPDLKALTRRLISDGAPVLTFSFHSTTMTPAANQYAPDDAAVRAALDLCENYFTYFREEIGGEIISLDQLASVYGRHV